MDVNITTNTNLNSNTNNINTAPVIDNTQIKDTSGDNKDYINNKEDKAELNAAIKKINTVLGDDNTHLEITRYDKLNAIMIKIIDDKTKQVIMEVPPKKILDMCAKLCELAGVLVDKKA